MSQTRTSQSAICRTQNPYTPRAGRGGAAHGGAAERSEAGQDGTPTGWFAQETTVPLAPHSFQVIEDKHERPFGNAKKRIPV